MQKQPPYAIPTRGIDTIVNDLLTDLRALNPSYSNFSEADPVYTTLQACAYKIMLSIDETNKGILACLLDYATGTDLDNLGSFYNKPRRLLIAGDPDATPAVSPVYESDIAYRAVLKNAFASLSLGSAAWYSQQVISTFPDEVNSVGALGPDDLESIPAGEIHCYIDAIGNDPIPSSTLIAKILAYLTDGTVGGNTPALSEQKQRFLNDTIRVQSIEQYPYTISARIRKSAGLTDAAVKAELETIGRAFVEENRVQGNIISKSLIYREFCIPSVQSLDLDYPLGNVETPITGLPIAKIATELAVSTYSTDAWNTLSATSASALWGIQQSGTDWYLLFSIGITVADLNKLKGVGAGRKIEIIDKSTDPETVKLTVQADADFGSLAGTANRVPIFASAYKASATNATADGDWAIETGRGDYAYFVFGSPSDGDIQQLNGSLIGREFQAGSGGPVYEVTGAYDATNRRIPVKLKSGTAISGGDQTINLSLAAQTYVVKLKGTPVISGLTDDATYTVNCKDAVEIIIE